VAQNIHAHWRFALAFVLASSLTIAPPAFAGDAATVPALTAAFLYNFVKFTVWPTEALEDGQRLLLCVADDAPVAEALEQMIHGRSFEGHALELMVVERQSDLGSCHIFYVGTFGTDRSVEMIEPVRDLPVLTVGKAGRFAARGGVAELIVDKDRMRFAINVASAQRAGLQLSSRLLSLAEIVKTN
jgi:hypothetical protein